MKKILVIDDKKEERQKAKKVVEKAGHYCYAAEDLHEALLSLGDEKGAGLIDGSSPSNIPNSKIGWDGVITDLHFPLIIDGINKVEPYGLEIAILCQQKKIPCVICTDMNHHHTDWIVRIARRLGVKVVADKGLFEDSEEAWQKALMLLVGG